MARANPFRFSTKYQDDETDLLYYGRRYYSASTGRWLSRDPSGERGGYNLLAFVMNAPLGYVDSDGRRPLGSPPSEIPWPTFHPVEIPWPPRLHWPLRTPLRFGIDCPCYSQMKDVQREAKNWFLAHLNDYECKVNGKVVGPETFPGVVDGTKSSWGVAHCITWFIAAERGVSKICITAANFGHEAWEFGNLQEWRKDIKDWAIDTLDDMSALFTGYEVGLIKASNWESCIPLECKKKSGL
jgi:RHS repeat-associated protein